MNVKFFYCNEPPETVAKNLDLDDPVITVTNVRFTTENSLSVREPSLEFAPTTTLSTWSDIVDAGRVNYFYIPKFTRFYKITSMSTDGSHIMISGKSDPLTSFKTDVMRSTQYVVRQQNKRSAYMPDTSYPLKNSHRLYVKTFGKSVIKPDCDKVMLITAGKGGHVVNPS